MTEIRFYKDDRGRASILEWLREANEKVKIGVAARIQELAVRGHALNRPHAEHVRGDIYAFRIKIDGVQYRIFYFFHRRTIAILTHEIVKKTDKIPPKEIDRAERVRKKYLSNPERYTYEEATNDTGD